MALLNVRGTFIDGQQYLRLLMLMLPVILISIVLGDIELLSWKGKFVGIAFKIKSVAASKK